MKLSDILYETDYDGIRDQMDAKYIDAEGIDAFEVSFKLFDEDGDEVKTTGDAPVVPEVVEIEVVEIDANDNATYELTESAKDNIAAWLKTRGDYVDVIDYEISADYSDESGEATATAVKDDIDVGQK